MRLLFLLKHCVNLSSKCTSPVSLVQRSHHSFTKTLFHNKQQQTFALRWSGLVQRLQFKSSWGPGDNETFDFERDYQNIDQPRRSSGYRSSKYQQNDYDDEDVPYYGQSYSNRPSGQQYDNRRSSYDEFDIKSRSWESTELAPFERNFYIEHESVANLSESELEEFFSSHSITIKRGDRLKPILDFNHANFPGRINEYMSQNEWTKPTPIQSIGWPVALSGKNMVGIAQTGSGKTLGFILPALVHVKHQKPRSASCAEGPSVVVLAPTRELAQQINSVAIEYGKLLGIRSCVMFGGANKSSQLERYQNLNPEILIATPGRLLDFVQMGVMDLSKATYAVLDEADRMLDMGFEPQIRKILGQIRPDRQILMWSATWPKEIQQLAHEFLGDFTQVNVGSSQLNANPNIEQIIKICDSRDKMNLLLNELEDSVDGEAKPKTLVFTATKATADFIARQLHRRRFRADALHGDKTQRMRDLILNDFRRGRREVLVATDVAARGLDVNDITLVINYDYPNTADDYIHRIGRTARAGKTGRAVSFITDNDAGEKAKGLVKVLEDSNVEVPFDLQKLANTRNKGKKPNRGQPGGGFGYNRGGYNRRDFSYNNNNSRDSYDRMDRYGSYDRFNRRDDYKRGERRIPGYRDNDGDDRW